jgi:hypothetical protein
MASRNAKPVTRGPQPATRNRDLRHIARLPETAIMIINTLHSDIHPLTRPEIVGIRLALALTTGIPLLLSFLVPINRLVLDECPFLRITGLPGPFCGFTRSIWAISAGNWAYAAVNCPLAWLLYAALLGGFACNAGSMLSGTKMTRPWILSLNRDQANRAIGIVLALVLLDWIYRLCLGLT